MIEQYDFSLQCEELDKIQLEALNDSVVLAIANLQQNGALPLTAVFFRAEAPEYEIEFTPEGLEGMEPEGSA